ncbi:glycine cleavage T C-terminal barrel domain-containing protein [Lipingzhangella sp. LS1_29]|uniref:Glycine cleavage T C-terminal barrel domain-containing protein n=1 Tax=Lipingzhangella rawalii TaxID=2055835 RepID=A0ABU2H2S5_9ACTN|nr:glycine cleavage T C-terminal barrel domain-containing protein [Lipingzhangella rawalii]MDS1269596.1 glycine cleavage T C-terminal barrel domain-containing protein [Lipingzhangella rawalii]
MAVVENPEILLYSRVRKSPFFYASRRHGVAKYSVYNHTYHPRHYGDPWAEYWHLLNGVTLWDVGVERQVEITGPDAFDFTNMLVPRDLTKCQVGQCKYVFITNEEGGIINDPVLLRLGENHFWLSLADSDVLLWARGLAYFSGMDVTIREADVGPVQVQGPKSKDVMVDLFGEDVLDIPYYFLASYDLDGLDVVVSRTGYTSELGFEIYLRNASRDAMKLWDKVIEAGTPHGIQVIGPCHIRRIEGGILSWGCDIDYSTNPFEVGYGYEVSWMVDLDQEADFIGKEALRQIRDNGVSRKLAGVRIDGPSLGSFNDGSMIDAYPVRRKNDPDGEVIGKVTSACFSPRLEQNIGFALVSIEDAALGTEFVVETQHGPQNATVVEKPFIDPKKNTPKQDLRQLVAGS